MKATNLLPVLLFLAQFNLPDVPNDFATSLHLATTELHTKFVWCMKIVDISNCVRRIYVHLTGIA